MNNTIFPRRVITFLALLPLFLVWNKFRLNAEIPGWLFLIQNTKRKTFHLWHENRDAEKSSFGDLRWQGRGLVWALSTPSPPGSTVKALTIIQQWYRDLRLVGTQLLGPQAWSTLSGNWSASPEGKSQAYGCGEGGIKSLSPKHLVPTRASFLSKLFSRTLHYEKNKASLCFRP